MATFFSLHGIDQGTTVAQGVEGAMVSLTATTETGRVVGQGDGVKISAARPRRSLGSAFSRSCCSYVPPATR